MEEQACRVLNERSCPSVFRGFIQHWKAMHWSPEYFKDNTVVSKIRLVFRVGTCDLNEPEAKKRPVDGVLWERDCIYVEASFADFYEYVVGDCNRDTNPLSRLSSDQWLYADYKYFTDIFKDSSQIFDDVDWKVFGFANRSGKQSTFWLGTEGAYTPCHFDSYGFNLVAQIYGRKKWTLFPPGDTDCLYPTRIPFEESSVFSLVNIANPDLKKHPRFALSHRYEVILEPGDVLLVPKHWWHYVECLSTAISVNTWIETDDDGHDRVEEGIASLLVSGLLNYSSAPVHEFYNPKEEPTLYEENIELLDAALKNLDNQNSSSTIGGTNLCDCCEKRIIELHPCSDKDAGNSCLVERPPNSAKLDIRDIINYVTHPATLKCIRQLIVNNFT